jgi:Domain of unknown function (DUF397)
LSPAYETITEGISMNQERNGTPAAELRDVTWRKSRHSNSQGTCVELAGLGGGAVAVRSSRHPGGPALVFSSAEIDAFIRGAKDGEFDDLLG